MGVVLFVAFLIQVTLLSRLGLPGATPDLLVVCVVAFAFVMGPTQGAVAGFFAGALIDLAPPADSIVGVNSIVYLVVGFVAGTIVNDRDRTLGWMLVVSGGACVVAVLGTAALDAMLGSPRILWTSVPLMGLTTLLYGVLLARVVIPGVAWLTRSVAPNVLVD